MSEPTSSEHALQYDGKTHELYKIYLLSLLFSILTLGVYHFWGKTRKRRYITSSFSLHRDRFEYTGYGSELLVGLLFGLILMVIISIPLGWAAYTLNQYTDSAQPITQTPSKEKTEPSYHIEQYDHFRKNRLIIDYQSIRNFWIVFKNEGFLFKYEKDQLQIRMFYQNPYGFFELPIIFNPNENHTLLLAVVIIPIYAILYFLFFPFLVVYGSLRYRVSRLRWRGIRGHLDGSAMVYACKGLFLTFLKIITLGFWIPISDLKMIQYKTKKLFFGDLRAQFSPSYKRLITANLASLGACLYLIGLMAVMGYWVLPIIATLPISESWIVKEFFVKLAQETYVIFILFLIWGCYAPRYWYRAALLRERYNQLQFGNIHFRCQASGLSYFRLFVINDLIFIGTLGFGLPIIWQRRMRFFCQHVRVIGDLDQLSIKQAPGNKQKFGGGFASIMNLEIGLI